MNFPTVYIEFKDAFWNVLNYSDDANFPVSRFCKEIL